MGSMQTIHDINIGKIFVGFSKLFLFHLYRLDPG